MALSLHRTPEGVGTLTHMSISMDTYSTLTFPTLAYTMHTHTSHTYACTPVHILHLHTCAPLTLVSQLP